MEDIFTREETKSKLDLLFNEVIAYRQSKRFKELLSFCAKFKTLAPYNAMLVHLQMPYARFVLTPKDWKKYHRKIRTYARPMVILVPFGPVDFVFEIQDTYTPEDVSISYLDEDIIEDVEKPFRAYGHDNYMLLVRLINLMQYHGVAYNPDWEVGADCGAGIKEIKESNAIDKLHIYINKDIDFDYRAKFMVSTNRHADNNEKIASIAHELGHLFCGHLPCPKGWTKPWEHRQLQKDVKEFEAEAVAKMVCDRIGICNPSERYLASYLDSHDEIPHDVSIENICFASNKILTMCLGAQKITYRDGLLYKHDEDFKDLIKRKKAANQRNTFLI